MKKVRFIACILSLISTFSALGTTSNAYEYTDLIDVFAEKTYSDGENELNYRIYVPEDYAETRYPVILFLHGSGQRGDDNVAQLSGGLVPWMFCDSNFYQTYPAIVIAPQCPENEQWVNTPWSDGSYSIGDIPESQAMSLTFALTEQVVADYNADSERVSVTGMSMGGYGAWDIIERHSGFFYSAVPVCGAGDPAKAAEIGSCHVTAYHGDNDDTVPVSGTLDMCAAMDSIGVSNDLVIMNGYGHAIWDDVYANEYVYRFMLGLTEAEAATETDTENTVALETEMQPAATTAVMALSPSAVGEASVKEKFKPSDEAVVASAVGVCCIMGGATAGIYLYLTRDQRRMRRRR